MADSTAKLDRLSQIPTSYSALVEAHGDDPEVKRRAQEWLLGRYGPVIRKYLLGAVRDSDRADELFQQFFTNFVAGKLKGFDPDKGLFRHYVKTCLSHLTHAPPPKLERHVDFPIDEVAAASPLAEVDDRTFWRDDVLENAWLELEREERREGHGLYAVLRHCVDHPEQKSKQAAEALGPILGNEVNDGWVRKQLMKARARFAHFVFAEVERLVNPPTRQRVVDELIELLDLYRYCERFLDACG